MFEKTLWEKIGDMLAHPGKRFLLGILSVPLLWPFGILIAISILENQKSYFINNIKVRISNGQLIDCAIVKQKHYAYIPVFPFFCPFFYFPYKTEYYLIKFYSATETNPESRVYNSTIGFNIFNREKLTKAKALYLLQNPQIISKEIENEFYYGRSKLLNDIKPYIENKLFSEIYYNNYFSICKYEDEYILFNYNNSTNSHCGFIINEELVENAKKNNNINVLLDVIFTIEPQKAYQLILPLSDTLFERLLRDSDTKDSEISRESLEKVNNNKKPLTKEMVVKKLLYSCSKVTKFCGWALMLVALGVVELSIVGFVTGLIPMGIICAPIGIWLTYKGIKVLKNSKKSKENILNGRFKILKTTCVDLQEIFHESDDGNYYEYVHTFANGEKISVNGSNICIKGDRMFLIYLEGKDRVLAYYNTIEYRPAPDLIIEEDESVRKSNQKPLNTCKNCGKLNAETDKFCGGCGAKL